MFRLPDVNVVKEANGKEAVLNVKRYLKLKGSAARSTLSAEPAGSSTDGTPSAMPGSRGQNAEQADISLIQADLEAQRDQINQIDKAGYQIVDSFNNAVLRIEREVQKLNDTMQSFRRDLDITREDLTTVKPQLGEVKQATKGHKTAISELETQVESANKSVSEMQELAADAKTASDQLKRGLANARTDQQQLQRENNSLRLEVTNAKKASKDALSTAKEYGKEMASVRLELRDLRGEMEQDRKRHEEDTEATRGYTNEVSSLRWEIKQLAQQLEDDRATRTQGSSQTAKEHSKEIAILRMELKQLRHERDQERAKQVEQSQAGFSTRELDILTTNISMISKRASHVETLQMEVQLLKTRLQRLESNGPGPEPSSQATISQWGSDEVALVKTTDHQFQAPPLRVESRRKRQSNGRDESPAPDTPAKRPTLSPEYTDPSPGDYNNSSEWTQPSPLSTIVVGNKNGTDQQGNAVHKLSLKGTRRSRFTYSKGERR
jgi:prefoldin subunit 5